MPNGIDLIRADHQKVNDLFARFGETLDGGIVGQVIDSLQAHDDVEQGALYPLATSVLGDGDAVARSASGDALVKKQVDAVKALEGAPLVDAVRALQVLVDDHVKELETGLLPSLAERATPQQLEGLGARVLQIKQRVG